MSMPTYALRVGLETRTFAALQLTTGILTTAVGERDVLDLVQKVDDLPSPVSEFLPKGAYATLLEDGKPIFRGRSAPRLRGSRGALRYTPRLMGGWAEIDGRYYAQQWAAAEGDGAKYGRVALGWDAQTSAGITSGEQIRRAVRWAIDHGAQIRLGGVSAGVEANPEYVENQTCAQIVSRMLEATPNYVPYFDYSDDGGDSLDSDWPTFHCVEASPGLGLLDPAGGSDGVTTHPGGFAAIGLVTLTIPKAMFSGTLDIRQSFESQINGVVMVVKKQVLESIESAIAHAREPIYLTSWLEVKRPLDAVIGDDGVVPFSYDFSDFEGMTDLEITTLLGRQADAFLKGVAELEWSGSGTIKGQTAPKAPRAGARLNISGGDPEWARMNAIVRTSKRDLVGGTNTFAWGTPAPWSLAQLMALAFGSRRRTAFGESLKGEQSTGGSGEQSGGQSGIKGKRKGTADDKAHGPTIPDAPFGAGPYFLKGSASVISWQEGTTCEAE